MKKIKIILGNDRGFGHHYILGVIVIAVLALAGVRVYQASHASPTSVHKCLGDPSVQIEALPAGGTWNGNGKCYKLANGNGIAVKTSGITIENATILDPIRFRKNVCGDCLHISPIISVSYTASNVTLSNLTLEGSRNITGYRGRPWVGEEGIKLNGPYNTTINNVITENTFGDGLEVGLAPHKSVTTNLIVNGLTVYKTGRDAVTLAAADHATFNNINLVGPVPFEAWGFQSDIPYGVSNVTVNNATGPAGGVYMDELLQGPVTFNNANLPGVLITGSAAASSGQTVTFNGGKINERCDSHRTSDIEMDSKVLVKASSQVVKPATLSLNNLTLDRQTCNVGKSPKSPAWFVQQGGTINLSNVKYVAPIGGVGDNQSHIKLSNVVQIPYTSGVQGTYTTLDTPAALDGN